MLTNERWQNFYLWSRVVNLYLATIYRITIDDEKLVQYFYKKNEKMSTMEKNTAVDNKIFMNALAGSILFILAIVFVVTNIPSIALFRLPDTIIACVLAMSSFSFLYKAVKSEKTGVRQIA